MRILYDHQIFENQNIGGISRYFVELVNNLIACEHVSCEMALRYSNNAYAKYLQCGVSFGEKPDFYKDFFWGLQFRGKGRLYHLKQKFFPRPSISDLNKQHSIASILDGKYDIFHPTYYDDYFLKHLGCKPFVLTIYDMIHEVYPEYFSPEDTTSEKKQKLAHEAAHIIAISEHTKTDIVRLLGIPAKKVRVVHLGYAFPGTPVSVDAGRDLRLPPRYLLYVGDRTAYKNFHFFARSVVPLLKKDTDLHLVCVGHPLRAWELTALRRLGIHERVRCFQVNDAALKQFYRHALAFVFPSLYEGFGIPVLEAFSCGCPVIVSRTSSLPEVGGDAVAYIDPKDPVSIVGAVERVIYDEKVREELCSKGRERLRLFSWRKTAEETHALYREIVG